MGQDIGQCFTGSQAWQSQSRQPSDLTKGLHGGLHSLRGQTCGQWHLRHPSGSNKVVQGGLHTSTSGHTFSMGFGQKHPSQLSGRGAKRQGSSHLRSAGQSAGRVWPQWHSKQFSAALFSVQGGEQVGTGGQWEGVSPQSQSTQPLGPRASWQSAGHVRGWHSQERQLSAPRVSTQGRLQAGIAGQSGNQNNKSVI